jgi:hypothetical protein
MVQRGTGFEAGGQQTTAGQERSFWLWCFLRERRALIGPAAFVLLTMQKDRCPEDQSHARWYDHQTAHFTSNADQCGNDATRHLFALHCAVIAVHSV